MKNVKFDNEPLYSAATRDHSDCCCCSSDVWWWEPPKDSLPASYCRETSMHGLKYVAEPKRHLSERICWLLAFLTGVGAAAYLIMDVWDHYHKNPVIVSFQPTETDIKDIPFPAVTICNMNRFPKSLYEELLETSQTAQSQSARYDAKIDLEFLKSICGTQQSFAQRFDFAANRGKIESELKGTTTIDELFENHTRIHMELFSLLVEKTIPCSEQVRLCIWSEEVRNCSELFKPIVTEYGKCCTFNTLPLPLLLSPKSQTRFNDTLGNKSPRSKKPLKPRWDEAELNRWRQWDYSEDGFILNPELERPYRQSRAGVPFGLSVLIDPNTDQYFCPSSDSEGFRLVLHTPLEMPPVQNWGVAIGMGKEIFMEIMPRMTIADSKIFSFPYEKRKCYSQAEKTLEFYNAYTTSNCLDECIAVLTASECGCAFYYMQRGPGTRICSSVPGSPDYKCAMNAQNNLTKNFRNSCTNCDSLCTDIFYTMEQTQADLQSPDKLWSDPRNGSIPSWSNNSVSIIHLYFGTDSMVPQIRSQLYAPVDLIANTGGLLGLCLGFSALSAIEFLYFFTVRYIFQKIRLRTIGRRIANKFISAVWRSTNKNPFDLSKQNDLGYNKTGYNFDTTTNKGRVIDMDRNLLPCYPAYGYSDTGSGPQVKNNYQKQGHHSQGQGHQVRNGAPTGARNSNNGYGLDLTQFRENNRSINARMLNSDFYSNNNY